MKKLFHSIVALVLVCSAAGALYAQPPGQSSGSELNLKIPAYALTNITLHKADGSVTEGASIVWRNGVIEAAGTNVNVPFDAYVIDGGDSLHVYPGFIDGLAMWGSPEAERNLRQLPDPGNPPYARGGIQPERKPSELLTSDKAFEAAMKAGFTTAAVSLEGNMLPGQVQVFTLKPEEINDGLYADRTGMMFQFEDAPGGWGNGAYPSTLMGVMAQFRQLMFDAIALRDHINYHEMNAEMPAPERDAVLESLFPVINKEMTVYFNGDSKEDIERFFRLQDQFGFQAVLVSGKEASGVADELKRRNIPVLASVDVTKAPEWYAKSKKEAEKEKENEEAEEAGETEEGDETEDEEELSEEEQAYRDRQLAAWKDEVMNIKKLRDAGVMVGYASAGMELKDLRSKLEILLDEGGLTEEDLIDIMTRKTATILGINAAFGEVKRGANASFTVFDKPFTEKKAKATHSISNGKIHEF